MLLSVPRGNYHEQFKTKTNVRFDWLLIFPFSQSVKFISGFCTCKNKFSHAGCEREKEVHQKLHRLQKPRAFFSSCNILTFVRTAPQPIPQPREGHGAEGNWPCLQPSCRKEDPVRPPHLTGDQKLKLSLAFSQSSLRQYRAGHLVSGEAQAHESSADTVGLTRRI